MRALELLSITFMTCIASTAVTGSDFSFTSSGTLPHLEFFQKRVVDNADSATCFAITFNNATFLTSIRKHDPLLAESEFIIQRSHLLVATIGWNADCLATRRLINGLSINHFVKHKVDISPAKLALALADDAQLRSMESRPRPLACNSIIIGPRGVSGAAIFKVDVTGNFWKCQAAAIGKMSGAIDGWIRSKGIEIVAEKLKSSKSAEINEQRFCLELSWQCLKEVVGEQLPQYCIEIGFCSNEAIEG